MPAQSQATTTTTTTTTATATAAAATAAAAAATTTTRTMCHHITSAFTCGHQLLASPHDPPCTRPAAEHDSLLSYFKPKKLNVICPGCRSGTKPIAPAGGRASGLRCASAGSVVGGEDGIEMAGAGPAGWGADAQEGGR